MSKVLVETSARHVHVSEKDLETLFGPGYQLTVKKMLSQPGQYACAERVDVVGEKKTLTGVSILGPCRKETQVELSLTDARSIGVKAPIRESGDLEGSGACKLVGPKGEVVLEKGVIASRKEEMMSRSCEVKVDIYGRAAHIAKANEGLDAMAAGVEFYRKVTAMEAALPAKIRRLLKFGLFQSGTVCNVVSDHTRLEGSLRTFTDDVFYTMRAGIVSAGKTVERNSGCTVNVYMNDGYPPVFNPPELYDRVKALVPFRELPEPSMITEDFAWYQKYLPGMFFFLGTGDTPALHASDFDFDESILEKGADFFEKLAENYQ